ncbi:poly(rC)-binding protein 4 [Chiloscyllium plagiosum]|uniref:poly(rC)-binding protein 4 n=1 Tax=Chiloscyllium plagiosum TaxID=36176 RepID=UPI001CB8810B|nr:poly(rC)-binding protein 4 [Chiloscyllium plagiosum]
MFVFPLSQLIGCIIGRQGSKINEIRQMSGAQIKISNPAEGSTDRQITITGSPANISLAQYLINASLESAKSTSQKGPALVPELDISLSEPAAPSTAPASISDLPAELPSPLPSDPYLSSVIGVKPVSLLTVSMVSSKGSAAGSVTSKVASSSQLAKKSVEKQRFSPY